MTSRVQKYKTTEHTSACALVFNRVREGGALVLLQHPDGVFDSL